MNRRIGLGAAWLITLGVGAGLFAGWMGWLTMPAALDLAMGALALGGLWLVVWLPWDLYFAARRLAQDQDDSAAQGLEVPDRDRAAARRLTPRLLAVCLALHLLGAATLALVTWWTGGTLGYWFAAFFVLGMALRPVGASYRHLRGRLAELGERARFPREDVLALQRRVAALEAALDRVERAELPRLEAADARLTDELTEAREQARVREGRFDAKVDRVLQELERSMARLTEDRELLQGIRAFVRVIKQS